VIGPGAGVRGPNPTLPISEVRVFEDGVNFHPGGLTRMAHGQVCQDANSPSSLNERFFMILP